MILYLKEKIKFFLNRRGYVQSGRFKEILEYKFDPMYLMLYYQLKKDGFLNLIQIGAHDGVTGDPLNRFLNDFGHQVRVVFFEPQLKEFKKLKENYKKFNNFIFINKAVGKETYLNFYYFNDKFKLFLKEKFNKVLSTGINSFERNHLIIRAKNCGIKNNYEDYISQKKIKLVGLVNELKSSLGKQYNKFIKKLFLLQIDCEGFDDEVIYNSNLKKINPEIINFEKKNLPESRLKSLKVFLKKNNYELLDWRKSDILAIKNQN